MTIPTVGQFLEAVFGPLITAFRDGLAALAAEAKTLAPGAADAIDAALAKKLAELDALLNQPATEAALTEAEGQIKQLIATLRSAAPPDAGDMVG